MDDEFDDFSGSEGGFPSDADDGDDFQAGEGDDYDVEEDGTMSPVTPTPSRPPWEVAYSVRTLDDLVASQHDEAEHVAGVLGCDVAHAATLLRYFKWDRDALFDKYLSDPAGVSAAAGVVIDESNRPRLVAIPNFVCDICCDDSLDLMTLALSCGHRFCAGCYREYLCTKIKDQGESRRIQCMAAKCGTVVDEGTVEMCVPKDVLDKYRDLLLRTYVDDSASLRWCPAAGCDRAVSCSIGPAKLPLVVPVVKCDCGDTFCFGCGMEGDHRPCACHVVKRWLKKCADDSETGNWISANTKVCPKCDSSIEKNGGCNHMTCSRCRYEFCWVCAGDWRAHGTTGYSCNRFDDAKASQQTKSRAALERYLHYFNRYSNHQHSAELSRDHHAKAELKMREMQERTGMSWIETRFLGEAVDAVVACRGVLRWTYALAYYLVRDNMTHMFEDNQRDLEVAVEALSELLEKPVPGADGAEGEAVGDKAAASGEGSGSANGEASSPPAAGVNVSDAVADLRRKVMDKMVYCNKRREIVLEDTARGLLEKRWKFLDDKGMGDAAVAGSTAGSSAAA